MELNVRSQRSFVVAACELAARPLPVDPRHHSVDVIDDQFECSPERSAARRLLLVQERLGDRAHRWLDAGVDGVVTTSDGLEVLGEGLLAIASGESYISRSAARVVLAQLRRAGADAVPLSLTRRESDVLNRLVAGRTTKAMARDMGVSLKTVEAHRSRLFTKLGVATQAQAVSRALTDQRVSVFLD